MAGAASPDNLYPNYEENGRIYCGFRRGVYLLPCDETEKDRLDVMHTMFLTARKGRLLNAPFQPRPVSGPAPIRSRVLDLGCGTGIWLLDMAQKYKDAEFVGIDLAGMGPETLLPNVELRWPCDYESPWSLGEYTWDVIHLQMGLGSVSNWPMLYQKVITHLRPGVGWFEQVEIDFEPVCEDRTMPEVGLQAWHTHLVGATSAIQRSIAYNHNTRQMLEAAGFTDIRDEVYKLPLNGHSDDRTDGKVGLWYNVALSEGVDGTGGYGLEAMSLAPLTRIYQWPAAHVKRLCADALQQVNDVTFPAYNVLHVWTARSPYPNEPR